MMNDIEFFCFVLFCFLLENTFPSALVMGYLQHEGLMSHIIMEVLLLVNSWLKPPALARPTCLSCLTTGGPNKEHGAATEN